MLFLKLLDQYVLGSVPTNLVYDLLCNAWEKLTARSWEELYLDAFQEAVTASAPQLARYNTELNITSDTLSRLLHYDLSLNAADLPPTAFEDIALQRQIARVLAESGVLTTNDYTLTDEDIRQLLRNLVRQSTVIFRRKILENPTAFQQALLNQSRADHDLLLSVQHYLLSQFDISFRFLDDIKNDTSAIRADTNAIRDDLSRIQYTLEENLGGVVAFPSVPTPPRPMYPPEPTDFVGRNTELNNSNTMLNSNQVVSISGMPGVGKTALAAQLFHRLANSRNTFWHTFHQDEAVDVLVWKLAGWLAWLGQGDLWRMLYNQRQQGSPPPIETLFDYLIQLLDGHHYLVCLDDLHHVSSDPLFEQFIERLRMLVHRGELSLICTSRRQPAFIQPREALLLEGMSLADVHALLVARQLSLSNREVTSLHQRTAGNAQLVSLVANLLQNESNPAHLIERLDQVEHIEHFLLSEIDAGLDEQQRSVMGAISVLLGYPGTKDAIESLFDSNQSLQRTLTELSRCHLLVVGESEYGRTYSQHAIVQNFYYAGLSRRQRQTMHRRAGEYYEYEETDPIQAVRHYEQATDYDHAATIAIDRYSFLITQGKAYSLYHLLLNLKEKSLSTQIELPLLEALGDLAHLLGYMEEAAQIFRAATIKADDLLSRVRQQRKLGEVLTRLGEYQEALRVFQFGQQQLPEVNNENEEAALLAVGIGTVLLNQGRYNEALDQTGLILDQLNPDLFPIITAEVYDVVGKIHYFQGDFSSALVQFHAALDLRQRSQDQRAILKSYSNLAVVYGELNRHADAIEANEAALQIAELIGDGVAISILYRNIAVDYAEMGYEDRSIEFNQYAVHLAGKMGNVQSLAYAHYNLGDIYRHRGEPEQATMHLVLANRYALRLGEQHILIGVQRELAEVYLQQGRIDEAQSACQQALELANTDDALYWRPQILSSLGEIQRRTLHWDAARDTFREAAHLLQNTASARELIMLLLNWAQLEEDMGEIQSACSLCSKAIDLIDENTPDNVRADALARSERLLV